MKVTATTESTSNGNPKKPTKFLRYIHNFRGFAIAIIVANHAITYLQLSSNGEINQTTRILVSNGTVFFVFIAGFLFQFLSLKYEYKTYLSKKIQYVLLPYLFISIPAITLCILGKGIIAPEWFSSLFSRWSIPAQILMYLLTGAHLTPFWFIPMISIFYIISPVLLWVDRHPKAYWILPTLLTITAIVPRPEYNNNPMQAFVHFLSVYMLGMFYSHFEEKIFSFVQKRWLWLLAIFVLLTVIEIIFIQRFSAVNTLSKLILCILIIYFLRLNESHLPKLFHQSMGILAELSFGIYFIHDYFMFSYSMIFNSLRINLFWLQQPNLLNYSLSFFFALGGSVISLLLIRRILGKKSRYFVGC